MGNSAERGMLDSGWHFPPSFSSPASDGAQAPTPSILVVVVADTKGLEQVLGSSVAVGQPVYVIQSGAELEGLLTRINHSMQAAPSAHVKVGDDIWFDTDKGELVTNDTRVSLTPSEEEVLNVLLRYQNAWMRASSIANEVTFRLEKDEVSPHSVETIISTLRARGIPIHNKYGRGYRLMLVKEWPHHVTPK